MDHSTLTPLDPLGPEFVTWLRSPGFRKPLATVMHHTWSPTAREFHGRATLAAIRAYHVETRNASDIMANAYAAPDGQVWTARPLSRSNWAHALVTRDHPEPAAAAFAGGNDQWFNSYAFGLETVANFDVEEPFGDGLAAVSYETALRVLTVVHTVFGIPPNRLFFHRDVADKSCPGTKLNRAAVRADLAARLEGEMGQKIKVVMLPTNTLVECDAELEEGAVRCNLRALAEALGAEVNGDHVADQGKVYVTR